MDETLEIRIAVECLTLWMEPGDAARLDAFDHIYRLHHDPGGPGADHIIGGLLSLSRLLVLMLAKDRGATDADLLEKAGDILRDLSPRLPE